MRKNILVLLILVLTFTLNSFTVSADSDINFSDIKNHWAEPAIKAMAEKGIVRGYPDGTFKPDGDITKPELLSLIMRLKKEKIVSGNGIKVLDVKPTDWFYSDLENYLAEYDKKYSILNGNKFNPNHKATRGFMVGVLSAVIVDDLPLPGSGTTDFIDIDEVPEDLKDRLRKLSNMNVISGYPNRSFRPNNNISRAEVATILNKLYSKKNNEEKEEEQKSPEYEKGLKEVDQLFEEIYEWVKQDCHGERIVMGVNRNIILVEGHIMSRTKGKLRYDALVDKIVRDNGYYEFLVNINYYDSEGKRVRNDGGWIFPSERTNLMDMIKAKVPQ